MRTWEDWPKGFCFYCLDELWDHNRTGDHVVPISWRRRVTGSLSGRNIVPCCKPCNTHKSNIHPIVWMMAMPDEDARERLSEVISSLGMIVYEPPATDDHQAELERLSRYWATK